MKQVGERMQPRGQPRPAAFLVAGGLLLVQVVLIGLCKYDLAAFSELWIAPIAVGALVAALGGLIGLYPRMCGRAPGLAKTGRAMARAAGMILGLAALWMVGRGVAGGVPQPLPAWFLGLIAAFMVAFVVSFILTAAASLRAGGESRAVGWLLLVPVVSWGVILGAGLFTQFGEALKLDFYTNGVIALAFLGIGSALRRRTA